VVTTDSVAVVVSAPVAAAPLALCRTRNIVVTVSPAAVSAGVPWTVAFSR
jgi:hypothetical protein